MEYNLVHVTESGENTVLRAIIHSEERTIVVLEKYMDGHLVTCREKHFMSRTLFEWSYVHLLVEQYNRPDGYYVVNS
jgi:hypothetical protein